MYQQFYDEIAQDTSSTARAAESQAFGHSISLLEKAKIAGPTSRQAVEALYFLNRFWNIMLEDLASPENGLPKPLRAKLLSIGIWMIKQSAAIREGRSKDFQGLIDVSRSIKAGLEARPC
jgi:flagellar biosynthesis activator protein FlaF